MSDEVKVDLTQADKLEEVDHLKAQLLNRDMDLVMLQRELLNTKHQEVNAKLSAFSAEIVMKYGLASPQQVDVAKGTINRNESLVDPNA